MADDRKPDRFAPPPSGTSAAPERGRWRLEPRLTETTSPPPEAAKPAPRLKQTLVGMPAVVQPPVSKTKGSPTPSATPTAVPTSAAPPAAARSGTRLLDQLRAEAGPQRPRREDSFMARLPMDDDEAPIGGAIPTMMDAAREAAIAASPSVEPPAGASYDGAPDAYGADALGTPSPVLDGGTEEIDLASSSNVLEVSLESAPPGATAGGAWAASDGPIASPSHEAPPAAADDESDVDFDSMGDGQAEPRQHVTSDSTAPAAAAESSSSMRAGHGGPRTTMLAMSKAPPPGMPAAPPSTIATQAFEAVQAPIVDDDDGSHVARERTGTLEPGAVAPLPPVRPSGATTITMPKGKSSSTTSSGGHAAVKRSSPPSASKRSSRSGRLLGVLGLVVVGGLAASVLIFPAELRELTGLPIPDLLGAGGTAGAPTAAVAADTTPAATPEPKPTPVAPPEGAAQPTNPTPTPSPAETVVAEGTTGEMPGGTTGADDAVVPADTTGATDTPPAEGTAVVPDAPVDPAVVAAAADQPTGEPTTDSDTAPEPAPAPDTTPTPTPTPTPAPSGTTNGAVKDPGPNASVDDLLAAAREALTIDPAKAIEFGTRALEQEDTGAVHEVLALAHCHAGDGPNARIHFRELRLNKQRRSVTDACIPLDIDILYTGKGLSVKEHAVRARKRFDAGDFDGAMEDAKHVLGEKYSPGMSELLAKALCSKGEKEAGLEMANRMAKVHATAVRAHCGE